MSILTDIAGAQLSRRSLLACAGATALAGALAGCTDASTDPGSQAAGSVDAGSAEAPESRSAWRPCPAPPRSAWSRSWTS